MKKINIYGELYSGNYTNIREACRGIIISDDKILLSYERNCDQYMIPGGGVENNETYEECCVRELAEETGYIVKPQKHFLTINEHYGDWLFISHYYVCECVGKTEIKITQEEIESGLEFQWISLENAIKIFSKYRNYANENKQKSGMYLREYTALVCFSKNI